MEPVRKFKIIVNSKECGTCSGPTPSAVAKKVVKKLCGTSSKVVKFSLKECKLGCDRVCGPYQGQMEKLDRPCKRDGKTITHRVVCGKVRKMKGGWNLRVEDFEKTDDSEFKFDQIGLRPHIFFGEKKLYGITWYEYVIFNIEHFGNKIGIASFDGNNIEVLNITADIKNKLKKLLIELEKTPNKYKRIKTYIIEIERKEIEKKRQRNENEIKRQRNEYENEIKRQRNENENVNKGNEIKKAIKELRKYYKNINLTNTRFISDDLVRSLRKRGVNLSRKLLIKLINQEQEFIQTQIQKSINKHMQSNSINIRNVYNNIPENEETYYERFFQEGKRKANLLKTEEQKINNRNNN